MSKRAKDENWVVFDIVTPDERKYFALLARQATGPTSEWTSRIDCLNLRGRIRAALLLAYRTGKHRQSIDTKIKACRYETDAIPVW